MNVLTSNILSYAFSPVIWCLKKTTYATYTYFTGNKIVTISDQIQEQQKTIEELNDKISNLTEYIVDSNIKQTQNTNLISEYDIVDSKLIENGDNFKVI